VRLADEVSIIPAPDHEAVPHSEICIAGRPLGLRVPGRILEAAVELDGRYLVFLTEGVTMEELLSIHLITPEGRLVDTAAIGQIYSPGIFAGLALRPPREASFRFLGDLLWTVEVFDESRLALPMLGDAPAVTRPFGFRRVFRVRASGAA